VRPTLKARLGLRDVVAVTLRFAAGSWLAHLLGQHFEVGSLQLEDAGVAQQFM